MKVVCNSTVLIGLSKIGKLDILRLLFTEIYIPEEVYYEVVIKGKRKIGSEEISVANWIHRREIKDKEGLEMLARHINKGEAGVLILGKELKADLLIIDEDKARDSASSAGFEVIGLVGLLVLSKKLKLITKVKPLLDELVNKSFYLDDTIYKVGLEKAGELKE